MVLTSQECFFHRLKELIYDEEKIVTNLSLVCELKISLKDSLGILDGFVKDQQENTNDLYVTYLLCGKVKNGEGSTVYLVKGEDLTNKRNLFEVITTESVYSIQKMKNIDFNKIALTNAALKNGTALLVSKNSVKRVCKPKDLPDIQPVPATLNKISEAVNNGKSKLNIPENGKDHRESSQKQPKVKQNGNIASFFAKAAASKNEATEALESSSTAETTKLNRQTGNSCTKKEQSEKENSKDEKMEECDVEEKLKEDNNLEQLRSQKRKKGGKDNGPNKKRKRIQEISDSDSSDIFDDHENEDIIEMSDEEPPPPTPAQIPAPVSKSKRRKAVDKTYVDEEGFIVTTTEYIYESASDNEESKILKKDPEPKSQILSEKKNEKVNLQSKPSDTKGKTGKTNKKQNSSKQATLMSFFKKS